MLSITDNMGRKSLVALMAVSALVPVMSVEVSASTPNAESDFEFSDGVITKYVGESKDVVIPETIDGVAVTVIGLNTFRDNGLTSVKIPNSVTEIGSYAFSSNELTTVEIPNSVTVIGWEAFQDNKLTTVDIPNSVTGIGLSAFQNNELTSVTIPNSVTEIGREAFANNELTTVKIPDSVTSIERDAFRDNKLGSVEIPNSVTEIGRYAFSQNNLTSVEIPKLVTEIGENPFYGNPDLVEIMVASDNPRYMSTVNNNAIYTIDGTQLVTGTASMANSFLDTVTEIGDSAFYEMKISSVLIPDSVTSIRDTAFYDNELTTVEIPNSVSVIGYRAFQTNELTSVTIPESVTEIEWGAFSNNELTSVEIPNSDTEIGGRAFHNNPLTKITIPETVTSIGMNAFSPSSPLTTADVPIYGIADSEAENYATTNGHPFNPSDDIESSQEATLNLFGGTLSLDAPLFEPFGTVELTSEVQVVNSSFLDSFKVYDARGTGEGWRLDVTSTPMELVEPEDGFKEGTSTHVLPTGTLSLDPLESIKPFNDSNGILPSPILDVTAIIDDGAVTIAKADVGEGMGAFELTFGEGAFSATIDPSTAKIDKINYPDSDTPYEATVTWTLVSAP